MSSESAHEPVRSVEFLVSELPAGSKLTVPSIGIDFGTHFVRVAVVRKAQEKISIKLATFQLEHSLDAAFRHAATLHPGDGDAAIPVFYTGHSTPERLDLLKKAFPKASSVTRRDKLHCLNDGVHLLITSNLPEQELFYETTLSKELATKMTEMMAFYKQFMPMKMQQLMEAMDTSVKEQGNKSFPLILSIVGSNNIVCRQTDDGKFSVVDVRCSSAHSIGTFWNKIKHPGSAGDFSGFLKLAEKGDRRNIDSLTTEVADAVGMYSGMVKNYPLFDFGKMENLRREQVTPEDLARGILGLHTDLLACKAMDFAVNLKSFAVYFCGSLIQQEFFREELLLRPSVYGLPGLPIPKFFKTDAIAALGACLTN